MFKVLDVSSDVDLSQFSRLLWQRRLSHRIQQEEGRQLLVMTAPQQIPEVLGLYQQWQRGEIAPNPQDRSSLADMFQTGEISGGLLRAFLQRPLTLLLILVCGLLAYFAPLAAPTALTFDLLYPDFSYGTRTIILERVWENFSFTQLFRMLSPVLLHGGLLHLLFNMLWLWELGGRIESVQSSLTLGWVIVVLGLVSNTVQYIYDGGNNFGGMSGVVYGLFAYIWMWQLFDPGKGLGLPASLIIFMLLSLLIMTALGLSMIANAAHLGGFLCGILCGALVATMSRVLRAGQNSGGPRDQ
jgi:GlpG protein